MRVINQIAELQEHLKTVDLSDLVLVPTMGALHEGHLSLVDIAKQNGTVVLVTIFVNPLQFSVNDDLDAYPKTLDEDLLKLESKQVDIVFVPSVDEINLDNVTKIKANKDLASDLCGQSREGHFDGVCSIVNYFFELIKPTKAVFGEKDFQQLMVIKEMVERLNLNIDIIAAPIIRDETGLALSSRNTYLSEEQLERAGFMFAELNKLKYHLFLIKNDLHSQGYEKITLDDILGAESLAYIVESAVETMEGYLNAIGFKVEYIKFKWGRIFVAAQLGRARLIDNLDASI